MGEEIEPRRRYGLRAAALLGTLGLLLPAGILIFCGVAGLAVPRLVRSPILIFGGLAFALLVNVAASVRLRSEHTPGVVRLECDVRIRYRGANRTVVIVAGSLAAIIALYLIAENFAPR
jgi:hypothetical protein